MDSLKLMVIFALLLALTFSVSQSLSLGQQSTTRKRPLPPKSPKVDGTVARKHSQTEEFPKMRIAGTRSSNRWVETENGTRVAVGDGIEYDGIRIHMALTFHLVAIDIQTNRTLWSKHVSAFWNQVSIEKHPVKSSAGEASIVVALRSDRNEDSKQFVEYYGLKSGKKITPNKKETMLGSPIKPTKSFFGDACNVHEHSMKLITGQGQWVDYRAKVFGQRDQSENVPPKNGLFDDTKQLVLVVAAGDAQNCRGIQIASAHKNDERFLIRLHYRTFQSIGETPIVQPYGVFVLPKDKTKKYVIQRNAQNLIGGPAIWRTVKELEFDEP